MFLVCGGEADPNIRCLLAHLNCLSVEVVPVLTGKQAVSRLHWDIQTDRLYLDGRLVNPKAAFLRADVFAGFDDPRPEVGFRAYGWHTVAQGFAIAHHGVRIFNRKHDQNFTKPVQLHAARRLGLRIPATSITNDEVQLRRGARDRVVKPVNGGEYCQELADVLVETEFQCGAAGTPAIVQERLIPPDLRVFRVGSEFVSFMLTSNALDYRDAQDVSVVPCTNPQGALLAKLKALTDEAGLDFAAADFKKSRSGREWVFLEVNSNPMFAGFDAAANGKLVRTMIRHLLPS